MRLLPISHFYPSLTHRHDYMVFVQDTVVNDIGSKPINKSYRNVNAPVHVPIQVHPAAIISLSPDALQLLTDPLK
jgi:hypothetical protein